MRNVLVTGGSRGLGLGIVQTLANAGYGVIAVARSEGPELATLRESQPHVHFRSFDLMNVSEIHTFVKSLRKELGSIYGLVNNAGLGTSGALAMMSDAQIEALVRLNTISPMLLTKSVVRGMMADGQGRIVNIASIVAFTGFKELSVYSATKAALIGFTGSLAREIGQFGITVNTIAPGLVATEMTENLGELGRDKVMRRNAMRRLIDATDVGEAVAFLLGDQSKNITGTTLTVDAGATA